MDPSRLEQGSISNCRSIPFCDSPARIWLWFPKTIKQNRQQTLNSTGAPHTHKAPLKISALVTNSSRVCNSRESLRCDSLVSSGFSSASGLMRILSLYKASSRTRLRSALQMPSHPPSSACIITRIFHLGKWKSNSIQLKVHPTALKEDPQIKSHF